MTAFAQNLAILVAAIGGTWIVVQSFKLVANGLAAIAKRSPRVKATSPGTFMAERPATGGESNVTGGHIFKRRKSTGVDNSAPADPTQAVGGEFDEIEFEFNLERKAA